MWLMSCPATCDARSLTVMRPFGVHSEALPFFGREIGKHPQIGLTQQAEQLERFFGSANRRGLIAPVRLRQDARGFWPMDHLPSVGEWCGDQRTVNPRNRV
jgi:hypothetical protein